MIRRTDNYIQPAISSTIESSALDTSNEVNTTDTAPLEREAVSNYQDGRASLISELNLREQITQAALQNQFGEPGPAPITKDPSASRHDLPDVVRPTNRRSLAPTPGPTPNPAPGPGPAPVVNKSYLSLNDKGKEVADLQKLLNEWRANQNPPLPLIKEDQVFGADTEKAVKQFQKANGLDSDGLAGEKTKDRLEMENNSNFRKLDPDIKKQVREKFVLFQQDHYAREQLKELATDPNFANTSTVSQQELLNRLALNPADPGHLKKIQTITKDLSSMENNSPDFKNTSPDAKKKAIDRMYQYADNDKVRGHLNKILADSKFTKMPIDQQEKILKVFDIRKDSDIADEMIKIVNSRGWAQMDDAMKTRVLDNLVMRAGKVIAVTPSGIPVLDEAYTNNLAILISDPKIKFDQYSKQDKEKALNVFDKLGLFARGPFLNFMRRDINGSPAPLKAGPGNTGTALDQLNNLTNTALDPRITASKEQVMQDLLSELAAPGQEINPGNRHTSIVSKMTRDLAEQNPAEYARLVTELSTKGKATLANGDTITPPADAWQEDFSGRSVGERLLQSALMVYARPGAGYQNWNPGPDGIRNTKDDGFPNGNIDGYSPDGDVALKLLEGTRVFLGLNGKKP
jgi:peptidoglycan hydrolase-like protein with peptidoglycan-binding domain